MPSEQVPPAAITQGRREVAFHDQHGLAYAGPDLLFDTGCSASRINVNGRREVHRTIVRHRAPAPIGMAGITRPGTKGWKNSRPPRSFTS